MTLRNSQTPARLARARKESDITVASTAKLRYCGSSAQKTRLVVNEIRGKRVDDARAFLRTSRKTVARDVLKLLQSAVANTESADRAGAFEAEELFITRAEVGEGPMQKRIQPAPMGRAFPIHKRTCHITIELGSLTTARPAPRQRSARGSARASRTARPAGNK